MKEGRRQIIKDQSTQGREKMEANTQRVKVWRKDRAFGQ